jgi:anti-sigma factor RsiW
MGGTTDRTQAWSEETLHAYHDGELRGPARWRFERALRRNPALRRELDQLSALGDMLRDLDARQPGPDLWDAIALELPAADARRSSSRAEAEPAPATDLLWWLKPLGAVAATAAIAVVVYGGLFRKPEAADAGGVVRWIDTGERGVMVLDDDPDTTIIWILDGLTEGAWIGGRRGEV